VRHSMQSAPGTRRVSSSTVDTAKQPNHHEPAVGEAPPHPKVNAVPVTGEEMGHNNYYHSATSRRSKCSEYWRKISRYDPRSGRAARILQRDIVCDIVSQRGGDVSQRILYRNYALLQTLR
jgi:hypothetical protein